MASDLSTIGQAIPGTRSDTPSGAAPPADTSTQSRPHVLPWLCLTVALVSCFISTTTATTQWTIAIVFLCAAISSIAGFAFSPLAGALLFHINSDTVYTVQILLVSAITNQAVAVWQLRREIDIKELVPYLAGGALTVLPGILLLLNTSATFYIPALGCFMVLYGAYALFRPALSFRHHGLAARIAVGALGGLTSAVAAFPGAFITIWSGAQGWDKQRQRAITQPYMLCMLVLTFMLLSMFRRGDEIRVELLQFVAPVILGAYLGLTLYTRLSTAQFNRIVSGFLLGSGLLMTLKAF